MKNQNFKNNLSLSKESFLKESWKTFIDISYIEFGKQITDNWLKSLNLISWNSFDKIAEITVPNDFICNWVNNNLKSKIEKVLSRIFSEKFIKINIFVDKKNFIKSASLIKENKNKININNKVMNYEKFLFNFSKISFDFTFENFIQGIDNEVAYITAKNFSEDAAVLYNPLFIYGPSGTGKSHLIQAIGNYFLKSNISFIYQTTDNFIKNYIQSVKIGKIDQFEKIYESVNVLMIDDVEILAKKIQSQEIFLKIIINFQIKKKKIVITSGLLPSQIDGILDRLRSRFEGGLIVDLSMPSHDTLVKIIFEKVKSLDLKIDNESINYIASNAKKSIREVEGLLIRLSTYASVTKKELTYDLVIKIIKNFNNFLIDENPLIQKIFYTVLKKFNVTKEEVLSFKRNKNIVLARHFIMFFIRKYSDKSLKDICNILNRNDHSTIIYANKKVSEVLNKDKEIADLFFCIEKDLEKNYKINYKNN